MPAATAPSYTTPARVWRLGLPFHTLFGKSSNLSPGVVSVPAVVAQTGAGVVDAEGGPHDTYSALRLRCSRAGEINRRGIANPGQLPQFELSADGGTTWDRPVTCSTDPDRAFVDDIERGIRWILEGDTPTFDAGDEWSATATPSRDIVELIPVCSSGCDQFLVGSYCLPLETWPEFLERIVAWLVRWELIVKRGLAADQDMQQYNPEQRQQSLMGWSAIGWLQAAQRGDFQDDPQFGKNGKALVFPHFVKPALAKPAFGGRMWRA
jgi:phage gp36-like protein